MFGSIVKKWNEEGGHDGCLLLYIRKIVGFLFTENIFADIVNMTYSCCVELDMTCMGCGKYENRQAYRNIVNLTAGRKDNGS